MASNNQTYIVHGEVSLLLTAMKRSVRLGPQSYHEEENEPLLRGLSHLKDVLNNISDLHEIDPSTFLSPFLEVIRSEETTGPITGFALTSVNKFLSYGLVSPFYAEAAAAIENIADAVTHARFVGTDPSADEVVLMKILHVLRTLLLVPAGTLLSNEAVCEIMQSCFRICFEVRLSELLRKTAECTLMDMVQLLFARLPQLKEDPRWVANMARKLKMRKGGIESSRGRRKKGAKNAAGAARPKHLTGKPRAPSAAASTSGAPPGEEEAEDSGQGSVNNNAVGSGALAGTPAEEAASPAVVVDLHREGPLEVTGGGTDPGRPDESEAEADGAGGGEAASAERHEEALGMKACESETNLSEMGDDETVSCQGEQSDASSLQESDYVGPQGVRFTSASGPSSDGAGPPGHAATPSAAASTRIPYGLPCVRELLRFLVSLTNPHDRHNTDMMIHMGLSLLMVALESGADSIPSFKSLLGLVRDDMCKNLIALLHSERLSIFAASQRVCFLLFEAMRSHLKFQLEMYLLRLMEIITSDSPRIVYEQREVALESIVQLWRIPGLVTELYLNYDCDLYCSNLFEDLTKLLSKNAFPVSGLFTTHLLSLDALLTVIDTVEQHCHSRVLAATSKSQAAGPPSATANGTEVEGGEHRVISAIPECEEGGSPGSGAEGPPATGGGPSGGGGGSGGIWQPAVSGFHAAMRSARPMASWSETAAAAVVARESRRGPQIRPNRMRVSDHIPNEEELATAKHKKRLLQAGTEKFNTRPKDGIEFLQSHGLLSTPLNIKEVVTFLRENPRLDKRMIGEYISKRDNSRILLEFAESFHFEDVRIDESLRQYVEAFRMPGEAPLIQLILEAFADKWHRANREPFVNADAAFTLAYATLMLNTDQHNMNSRKQNVPMNLEEFRRNLKKANGGKDFEPELLEEIYWAIHNDEIVLPSEQTGQVRDNYLWKVLLRRGSSEQGNFMHAPTGAFDHDIFALIWGPTVAALSFVFDKTANEAVAPKAIAGFRKCAMISAHYGLSDVFDNLVISLCKFTTLLSAVEVEYSGVYKNPESLPVSFGRNNKAQMAARAVFGLAYRHGDILRDGWKNLLDCLLQLFKAKLLPDVLVEVEDFVDPHGRIRLIKEDAAANQKQEIGMLSSFYHYFTSDSGSQRGPTAEEQEAKSKAVDCVQECHIEQLLQDSKFLRMDSLTELVKALLVATKGDCTHDALANHYDEEARVFYFELLMRVLLQNRDRLAPLWGMVREHFYMSLIACTEPSFLLERTVAGLLRLANRLLRREAMTSQVFSCLRLLVLVKTSMLHAVSRQLVYGLYELIHTHAPNIHSREDWQVLFTLLEVCGAGSSAPALYRAQIAASLPDEFLAQARAQPGYADSGMASSTEGVVQSDSEVSSMPSSLTRTGSDSARGYTSDSELYETSARQPPAAKPSWILMDEQTAAAAASAVQAPPTGLPDVPAVNPYSIVLQEELRHHDTRSLLKASETLAFLVRDAAHVTPANFEACVHTVRLFVEASLNGGRPRGIRSRAEAAHAAAKNRRTAEAPGGSGRSKGGGMRRSKSSAAQMHVYAADSGDEEERGSDQYHSVSMQLLDLMHTLHTRAAPIYSAWSGGVDANGEAAAADYGPAVLWDRCWCPLLQGIARLGCDARRQVRSQAMNYLHRALLDPELQKQLGALEWESCFNKVLFPLLSCLLDNINPVDPNGMEETRIRALNLLSRVFLQHLGPLFTLPTFLALWLTILDFLDKYMHIDKCDLLREAIPESLKNMLLVMDTASILRPPAGPHAQMWQLTWHRVSAFLPHLRDEIFPAPPPAPSDPPPPAPEAAPEVRESSPEEAVVIQMEAEKEVPVVMEAEKEVPVVMEEEEKGEEEAEAEVTEPMEGEPAVIVDQQPRPQSADLEGTMAPESDATPQSSSLLLEGAKGLSGGPVLAPPEPPVTRSCVEDL